MTLPRPVRVIGCGSQNGDDAAAWRVIERLRGRVGPGVDLFAVEGGHAILDLLDGRGSLVLIDAASSGAAPGTLHRLRWPSRQVERLRPQSTHGIGLDEALALAAAVGTLPDTVLIVGIEIARVEPGAALSEPVAAAVSEATQWVLEQVGAGSEDTGNRPIA